MKTAPKHSLLTATVLLGLSNLAIANDSVTSVSIPMIENAHVFADFSNDIPAVLNYFTLATEEQILHFYNQNYGKFISQKRKRNRLTLTYHREHQSIRVTISQQNNQREVDIIVDKI